MNVARRSGNLTARIIGASAAIMVVAGLIYAGLAMQRFEQVLRPHIVEKADMIATSAGDLVARALEVGYPIGRLNGLEEYFADVRHKNPEVRYIALVDGQNTILYSSGVGLEGLQKALPAAIDRNRSSTITGDDAYHTVRPLQVAASPGLRICLGMDKSIVWGTIKDSLLDILTLFAVSLLVMMEIFFFLIDRTITAPLASIAAVLHRAREGCYGFLLKVVPGTHTATLYQRFNEIIHLVNSAYRRLKERCTDPQALRKLAAAAGFLPMEPLRTHVHRSAVSARLPLFLVIFADSLAMSFFPLYVDTLYKPLWGISREMAAGLPISIFMLFWAISLPLAGAWSDRRGRYLPFVVGASITALGTLLTGFSQTIIDLVLWRSLTAVGYSIVFITCQGAVIDTTTRENRTAGLAMFLSAFFAGSLCGSAIGGILADRIGFRATYIIAAVLGAIAAAFASRRLSRTPTATASAQPLISMRNLRVILRNPRLLSLVLLCAIPAKICLTGFVYYAAPLLLKSLGNSQSSTGRILMCYGLAMVLISPAAARVADRFADRRLFIALGGIVGGIGLLAVNWFPGRGGILAAVALLGLAHSVGTSSQLTFASEVCCGKDLDGVGVGTVIALYRVVERLGNILGPILAGLLISLFGFGHGISIIGVITAGGTVLFLLVSHFVGREPVRAEVTS